MKLEAISYARIHNNRAAAKRFNIYEKRIREWTKKQEALFLTRTTTVNESKEGLGRCREDLRENAHNQIHGYRESRFRVSRTLAMKKAKALYKESVGDNLCAK